MKNIVLIPAAGVGHRFGAMLPKQYSLILDKPMLQHTLDVFAHNARIWKIIVIVSPQDDWFESKIRLSENAYLLRIGGETRAQTVANGVNYLLEKHIINDEDMILVHDAARCCLSQELLNRLLNALPTAQYGALLAVPVADTMKRQNAKQCATETVSREGLWQAQTPQAFQAALLQYALQESDLNKITDESSAVESLGFAPLLVFGDSRNIKLTHPEDAMLAEYFLSTQTL
ncbi:MAG: 2-C-methyl-D-erythritol 4-phosphate cytidylyltransferase [Kingella sp. (in: b-proteobacteria)]